MIDIKYIFENKNNSTKHHIHTMDEVERLEKLEKKLRNRKRILSAILGAGGGALLGSKYGPAGTLGGLLAGGISGVAGNALSNLGHTLKTRINYGPDDDNPDLKYYKSLARQFANNQSII